MLTTRNATQSAPLSSPSCVSSKDHLLAAHESLREALRWDTPSHLISACVTFHIEGFVWLTYGAFCFYRVVTSFFYVGKIDLKGYIVCAVASFLILSSVWVFLFLLTFQEIMLNKKAGTNKKWMDVLFDMITLKKQIITGCNTDIMVTSVLSYRCWPEGNQAPFFKMLNYSFKETLLWCLTDS